jgi:hypothetical protein
MNLVLVKYVLIAQKLFSFSLFFLSPLPFYNTLIAGREGKAAKFIRQFRPKSRAATTDTFAHRPNLLYLFVRNRAI